MRKPQNPPNQISKISGNRLPTASLKHPSSVSQLHHQHIQHGENCCMKGAARSRDCFAYVLHTRTTKSMDCKGCGTTNGRADLQRQPLRRWQHSDRCRNLPKEIEGCGRCARARENVQRQNSNGGWTSSEVRAHLWLIRVQKACEGFRVSRDMCILLQP